MLPAEAFCTSLRPDVATVPVRSPARVQEVAPVEDQLIATGWLMIAFCTSAFISIVGGKAVTVIGPLLLPLPPPPQPVSANAPAAIAIQA
jgi:hypothetical protein